MNNNHYVAIMAGGVGSRFWPASREAKPKQFLDILGIGKSLLQMTYERFLPLIPKENIFVVTNAQYLHLVKEQLPELSDNQILAEPSRNNTAPCLAYTALKLRGVNEKATFVVASSDHLITNESLFLNNIAHALAFAESRDALVTLGITPSHPNTGYGYIHYNRRDGNNDGIFKVNSFIEKPNLEKARQFVEAGNYLWNAGIFIWSAKSLIKAFDRYAEDIIEILQKDEKVYNTPAEQEYINLYYPLTRAVSIDYAIMEKAENVYIIPSDFGWSDLGTWASLFSELKKDEEGNVVQGKAVIKTDVSNSYIRVPDDTFAVLRGLDDCIVILENNTLLIYPKSKEQEIKQVTEIIKQSEWKSHL
jgi:mannose-1-phosphate guanylyltransferase